MCASGPLFLSSLARLSWFGNNSSYILPVPTVFFLFASFPQKAETYCLRNETSSHPAFVRSAHTLPPSPAASAATAQALIWIAVVVAYSRRVTTPGNEIRGCSSKKLGRGQRGCDLCTSEISICSYLDVEFFIHFWTVKNIAHLSSSKHPSQFGVNLIKFMLRSLYIRSTYATNI